METPKLRLPGFVGFSLVILWILVFFLTMEASETLRSVLFLLGILNISVVAVLCLGALVTGVRGLLPSRRDANNWSSALRWLDVVLGFLGISIMVFIYLGTNPHVSDLYERVFFISVMLFSGAVGYLLLSGWKRYGIEVRLVYAVLWLVGAGYSDLQYYHIACTQVIFASYGGQMTDDLTNIAAEAYQYRNLPADQYGGGGSYRGFAIPTKLAATHSGKYSVTTISADTIEFSGVNVLGRGGLTVKVAADGKPLDWQFRELEPPVRNWEDWFEAFWNRVLE